MKTEVKTEIKEEPFEKFEAREQGGILQSNERSE